MWISFPEKKQKLKHAAPAPNFVAKVKSATSNWEEIFLGKIWIHFFHQTFHQSRAQTTTTKFFGSFGLVLVYLDDLVLSPFYLNKFWVMMLRKASSPYSGPSSHWGVPARQQYQHQQPLSLLILPQQKRIYYELARYFLHHRRHL